MTQSRPTGTTRPPAGAYPTLAVPLFVGLLSALAVFGLLFFAEIRNRDARLESENADSLMLVRANMKALWDRAALVGVHAARHMNGADAAKVTAVLVQYKSYWPEAGFSVYDKEGRLIELPGREKEPAPSPGLARELVNKALVGQNAQDLTLVRGFVSLSASVPVRGNEARALVVSVPLDSFALESLKPLCKSDLALLLVDEMSGAAFGDTGTAANTFSQSQGVAARAWPNLGRELEGAKFDAIRQIPLSDGLSAVALPLSTLSGRPLALLVTAPLQATGLNWNTPWRMGGVAASGVVAAILTAYILRRRGRRMADALAGAVQAMTDERPDANLQWRNAAWPAPLASALDAMALRLKEYKVRAWNAERDREIGRRQATEGFGRENERERNFDRLFGSMPTGAFQTERDGRFIRVNQAFALLLGYDSPTSLLVENTSFAEFFLYGDELRNPLSSLAVQPGERHLVSLRRRDGKVRHFALVFSPSTLVDDDPTALIEGFLLDRSLDEQLTKSLLERDFAKRQRFSLALLLAATCKKTQGYLDFHSRREQGEAEAADKELSPQFMERRKGLTAAMSMLGDIYQIAMAEAEGAPPASMPLDLERFLVKTCRQVLKGLADKGVSLRCEVAEELPARFGGPTPLLRHTLQRALITVTATASGGWAWLSVARDPNAPKSPGLIRVLFSVSWSAYSNDPGSLPGGLDFALGGNNAVVFDAPADPDAVRSGFKDTGFELGSEQEVIRYLAQRMHGELLEGAFTNDTRSIQIIVPLDIPAADELEAEAPAPVAERDESVMLDATVTDIGMGVEVSQAAPPDEEGVHQGSGPDEPAQPLELLVIDEGSDPLEAETKPGDGLDILLVDDSLNNRLLFSLFLRETRHRITETHDGQEGVEAFQRGKYDIIFMDMEMPLMDGYQATRIIRALEVDKGLDPTPIVGMTTYALPEFRRQCVLSGCTDFLAKPFTKTSLLALLDAFTQMKQDAAQGVRNTDPLDPNSELP